MNAPVAKHSADGWDGTSLALKLHVGHATEAEAHFGTLGSLRCTTSDPGNPDCHAARAGQGHTEVTFEASVRSTLVAGLQVSTMLWER